MIRRKRKIRGLDKLNGAETLDLWHFRRVRKIIQNFGKLGTDHEPSVEMFVSPVDETGGEIIVHLKFSLVCGAKFNQISCDGTISGLYIEDITVRGWEDKHWRIGDYEEDEISFYARDVEIVDVQGDFDGLELMRKDSGATATQSSDGAPGPKRGLLARLLGRA